MRRSWICLGLLAAACAAPVKLLISGDEHELRTRPPNAPKSSTEARPPVVIVKLDGVSRDLLYDMIKRHELPSFDALLGDGAYFNETMVAAMPTLTIPAWVTSMTGVGPAEHGVPGNEFFIRETQKLACPIPSSFTDSAPTLSIYTDRYLDRLVEVPTVYERLREKDPDIQIWVSMNHLFRGADKLLLPKRGLIVDALGSKLNVPKSKSKRSRDLYAALDEAAIDAVVTRLGKESVPPDVLTVYISGTDNYAHVAEEGPDKARRDYLREIVDPALAKLVKALRERGMADRMWTVVIADHGHTQVVDDEKHALGGKPHPARVVLERAGFRVRPFKQDVPATDPFSAVLAYGGAAAYVYLADRSQCSGATDMCSWKLPPRYAEDVLAAAQAFDHANREGPMKNTLDMILTRQPRPFAEDDLPFEVYVGDGKTMPINEYLRLHPHPTYIGLNERLKALAAGRFGERAGDIMLLTHMGDKENLEDRFYFTHEYRSMHGSPSRAESEIPLIVANKRHGRGEIREWVQGVLGNDPAQSKVTDIILGLRSGALERQ